CSGMITAQWAKGHGGLYRYYRCTKKSGKCEQGYLREEKLVSQLKERLQQITLPDDWLEYMTRKTDAWEKEENLSSGSAVEQVRTRERETQEKLDNLVTLYLDGDIPKLNYLAKKNELLLQKVSLAKKLDSARQERKNWVEPLREWILDMKKATQLVSSDDFFEIRDYFKKIGTNPLLRDKSVSVSFSPPTEFAFACKAETDFAHPLLTTARQRARDISEEVSNCALGRN
ncbi:MAG: zinc ribbon domain-containing protein, partial [Minisyncoccia bacterium]